MASIKYTLLLCVSFVYALVAQADNSTCSSNLNSVCTILPFDVNNSPDVWLHVPNLSVDEITLLVQNITAAVSVSANVAGLATINAGVDISIDQVNLTITGVKAVVQLAVYLDNVAAIVNRTIQTVQKLPQLVQSLTGALPAGGGVLPNVAQPLQDTVADPGQRANQVLNPAGIPDTAMPPTV